MNIVANALFINDISELKKAIKKYTSKNEIDCIEIINEDSSNLSLFIPALNVELCAYSVKDNTLNIIKRNFPDNSNKFKNADSLLCVSIYPTEYSFKILLELIKCHNNFGYIMPNINGFMRCIDVSDKGLVLDNLENEKDFRIQELKKYFNDLPLKNNVEIITSKQANSLEANQVYRIFAEKNKGILEEDSEYFSEIIVLTEESNTPYIIDSEDLYRFNGNMKIVGNVFANIFMKKIPESKITYFKKEEKYKYFSV